MNEIKNRYELTQLQKLMVFVLSMSLYGLSSLVEELLPALSLGPISLSAEYFAFVPLVMCMLFHPVYTALGAATGGLLFGGVLAGQFGGFGEFEQFIALSLGLFVAGSLVKDPKNRKQIAGAALAGAAIYHGIGSMADIQQIILGLQELQAVPGMAELLIFIEVTSFALTLVVSGLLFSLLPVIFLVPILTGKIEPLLGMKVRDTSLELRTEKISDRRAIAIAFLVAGLVCASDYLYETGFNIEWHAGFGQSVLWINLIAAAAIAGMTLTSMAIYRQRSLTSDYDDNHFSQ